MSDAPAPGHQIRPRRRFRRDESGLTTLEWLLIVAAVAGLAALAVVLVNTVVDDTAEQISGNSARRTAAELAAAEITQNAHDAGTTTSLTTQADWNALEASHERDCNRLEITYGDIEDLTVAWNFGTAAWSGTIGTAVTNWRANLDGTTAGTDDGCVVS